MSKRSDAPVRPFANLAALVDDEPVTGSEGIKLLPLNSLVLYDEQPRRYIDSDKLVALAKSIQEHGVLQPLLVRPVGSGKYQIVFGERRYRAAGIANVETVPCRVRELDERKAFEIATVENLEREDINAFEETESIIRLLASRMDKTAEDAVSLLYQMNNALKADSNHNVMVSPEAEIVTSVFEAMGRFTWESFVANRLPLLRLPDDVKTVLRAGKLQYTKAVAIAKVKDAGLRERLIARAIAEGLSLAQIKEEAKAAKGQGSRGQSAKAPAPVEVMKNFEKLWSKHEAQWKQERPESHKKLSSARNRLLKALRDIQAELGVVESTESGANSPSGEESA